jgi:transmembrane sensor
MRLEHCRVTGNGMSDPTNNIDAAISGQARDWVLRLASGEMDAAELDRLKAWLAESDAHARAFEQRRSLWLALGNHPEMFVQPALPPVRHRPRNGRRVPGSPRRRASIAASAVAASLLAVMAAPEMMLCMVADHRTSASVAEFALPDGSTAWLDAGAAISVDFDARQRRVTLLRGNAFFAVRHREDRPFRVAALSGMVEDIGTSFEVRRQEARVDVAVTEGVVRLTPDAGQDEGIVLRRGEGAGYNASGALLRRRVSNPDDMATWRRKELMIDRQPLANAIHEIARYRTGPTWIWADLSDRTPVNGAFRIDDADAALRDLAAGQGLTVTWLPGDIAVIRRGKPAR